MQGRMPDRYEYFRAHCCLHLQRLIIVCREKLKSKSCRWPDTFADNLIMQIGRHFTDTVTHSDLAEMWTVCNIPLKTDGWRSN